METIKKKTESIKNFSLDDCPTGNKGYERVLLQLFGFLGHGKSSFINSCKYVLEDGEFQTYADVTQQDGGNTKSRISYRLTDTLTLVDNRGCSVMNNYELGEVYAQLGNLLPLDKFFSFGKKARDLRNRIIEAENEIKSSDFIFPIFVYSVKNRIGPGDQQEIQKLLISARDLTGIFPVIVLTHKMNPNLKGIKAVFKNMGAERIFPLENFTPEDHLKTKGKHEEVLNFFSEVINDIKFCIGHFNNKELHRQNRKKFVLEFVHERELEKQQGELARKAEQQKQQYENELKKERQRLEEERRQNEKKIQAIKAQKKEEESSCVLQ